MNHEIGVMFVSIIILLKYQEVSQMSLPPQMGLSSVNHPSWMIYCEKAPTLHLNINNLYSTSIFFTFMCDGQPALIQLKKGLRVLIARPYIILTADWRPVFHLSLSILEFGLERERERKRERERERGRERVPN